MSDPIERIAERVQVPQGNPANLKSYWAEIKDGQGKVTGYIELFWGGKLGWVSIPGASRMLPPGSEEIS
jgi:hypothetical protein